MAVLKIRNIKLGEGMPKIIVPLMAKTGEQLLEECRSIIAHNPDIIEWRIDEFELVEELDIVEKLLFSIREIIGDTPLLFTFRTIYEGGNKDVSLPFYKKLLTLAVQSKQVDLVDIELYLNEELVEELVGVAKDHGVHVVMSNHDFQQTPEREELLSRFQAMLGLGADIPKLAVMANDTADLLTLLEASQLMKEQHTDRPYIAISMGKNGLVSRIAGEIFGSAATFASGNVASAPGQIPILEMQQVLRILHKHST